MTHEEFDHALETMGISTGDAAKEMAALGDAKTSASYVSAMRTGRKPVTQAAAIYVRLKQRAATGGSDPAEAVARQLEKLARELRDRAR